MSAVAPGGAPPERAAIEKPYIAPVDPELSKHIEELLFSGYVLGMDHASSPLLAADDPVPPLPFKEAIAAISSRVPLTKPEWKALEPKLRFRAFTVARLSTADAIERVRESVISALDKGKPFAEFWTQVHATQTAGIAPGSPWYWETVFRTNVQTAYNTGRAAEFMRVQPEYLEFIGIEDERQTWICAQRSGVVRPASDPWWQSNWPPLHFNCRSTVRALFQEEVDILREKNPDWQITPDESIGKISGPEGDFGANPLSTESFWKLTPQMLARAESYGIAGELRTFAKSLGLADPIVGSELTSRVPSSGKPGISPEYLRELTDASGGYVDASPFHGKQELKGNIEVASVFAKRGKKVALLPVDHISKSPDALIDGEPVEFKTINSSSSSAIANALKSGKAQAPWVVLKVQAAQDHGTLKNVINDRVHRSPGLAKVTVMIGKRAIELTRQQILSGDFAGL